MSSKVALSVPLEGLLLTQPQPVCAAGAVELRGQPGQIALAAHRGDLGLGGEDLRLQQEARGLGVGLGQRCRRSRQRSPSMPAVPANLRRRAARASRGAAAASPAPPPQAASRARCGQRRAQRQGARVKRRASAGCASAGRDVFHHESLTPRRVGARANRGKCHAGERRGGRADSKCGRRSTILSRNVTFSVPRVAQPTRVDVTRIVRFRTWPLPARRGSGWPRAARLGRSRRRQRRR